MTTILIIEIIAILLCLPIIYFCGKKIIKQQLQLKDLQYEEKENVKQIDYQSDVIKKLSNEIDALNIEKEDLIRRNNSLCTGIQDAINSRKKVIETAFLEYCALLESQYEAEEKTYNDCQEQLKRSYEALWDNLIKIKDQYLREAEIEKENLEKIRQTRIAATEAMVREQEIKEQKDFYSLSISASDLFDIQALEAIKQKLTKPRILSMLIWQTYYQKQMTSLCNNVLGVNPICGIYKITNQLNNKCYIGQAVNIADRWKEHAKCGLGIDTPAGNKLYQAMQQDGICNFTWELIEKCTSAELNEKEKYYIEFYLSKDYGYNSLAGNSKK